MTDPAQDAEDVLPDQRRIACREIGHLLKRYYDATMGWTPLRPDEEQELDHLVAAWWTRHNDGPDAISGGEGV